MSTGFQFNPMAPSFVPSVQSEPEEHPEQPKSMARPVPRPSENCTLHTPRTPGSPRVTLSEFEIISAIGDGLTGRVYLVRYREDQKTYAMKVIPKDRILQEDMVDHMHAERRIQSSVSEQRHPFMVPLFFAFQDDAHLFLIQEYVPGGDLRYHLNARCTLPEEVAMFIAAELVLAIEHLHQHHIIHRDIKASNVLIDKEGHARLTDFGMSKQFSVVENSTPEGLAHTFCGTQPYMAPEILAGGGYSREVDWWALGVLLYETLTGMQPFTPASGEPMLAAITSTKLAIPADVSENASHLLRGLLSPEIESRLCTASAIREHPFFSGLDWEALRHRRVKAPWTPYFDLDDDEDVANFPFDVTDSTPPTTEDFAEYNRNVKPASGLHMSSFSYVSPAMPVPCRPTASPSEMLPFSMDKATPILDDTHLKGCAMGEGATPRASMDEPAKLAGSSDALKIEGRCSSGEVEEGWDPCFAMSL